MGGAGKLKRELGVFGATMMGLGSIIGTGIFVSVGMAAGIAGPAVVLAIAAAAVVATCNALSSAQLAACHSVSGGTYEYGYAYLTPALGFTAGWMFLCAKSASAATAALGFGGYLLHAFGKSGHGAMLAAAVTATVLLTVVVLMGMRRSNWTNIAIVSITLAALAFFVVAGLPRAIENGQQNLTPFFAGSEAGGRSPFGAFLEACALMFVAFTGYGRIATLGEEVKDPRRTIPTAIITTLVFSAVLYITVALIAVAASGAGAMTGSTMTLAAPLEVVAASFSVPSGRWVLAIGAITAMLGVLLNLILGLSRVLLAMGRRGDVPTLFARLDASRTTPYVAVAAVGTSIVCLALIGNVKTTWSFSAFTVLIYYALTNLAALRLSAKERLYSPLFAWGGLMACLFLAFWVEPRIWMAGLALIAAGLLWHAVAQGAKRA
ncbi:MAG: amino acid permease [Candidatus Hydrogenedentes bacterium]|nr:amino acid permease [Candidatus Hydrogenedentota bacterium]